MPDFAVFSVNRSNATTISSESGVPHLDPQAYSALPFGTEIRRIRAPWTACNSEMERLYWAIDSMDVRRATLLILLTGSTYAAYAQEDSTPVAASSLTQSPAKLLVLVDGQVISGDVTPRPDGYDIQVPGGRIYINSDRVRFSAANLPDAYDHMRESLPEFTPANHLELARWCLTNKLYSQARREVLDALYLDPNRNDAKRMLQALEQVGKSSPNVGTGTGLTEYPSQVEIQRPAIETRSLAGLSRSVAHSFVRDVQPLLMNKCATAGCHGPRTKSQFQLTSTHRGSTPAIAESNLAAVLRQVDFSQPASSPLLEIGERSHGNMASSVYRGRSGAMQMKVMRDWILQAADDIAPDAPMAVNLPEGKTQTSASGIQLVSAIRESEAEPEPVPGPGIEPEFERQRPEHALGNPHARQLTTDDTDGKFIQAARYANRRDAFSPDEFNLQYHGRTTHTSADRDSSSATQSNSNTNQNEIDAQAP